MDQVKWPIFDFRFVTPEEFVSFWDSFYRDYDEDVYQANIRPTRDDQILKLFEWKNGRPLSQKKTKSIRKYFDPKERVIADADDRALQEFLSRAGGAIWRIFWLHAQHPESFPIYDQHVHRAMAFLLRWPKKDWEILKSNQKRVRTYLRDYLPFSKRFVGCDTRKTDRAVWAFGRFLGRGYSEFTS